MKKRIIEGYPLKAGMMSDIVLPDTAIILGIGTLNGKDGEVFPCVFVELPAHVEENLRHYEHLTRRSFYAWQPGNAFEMPEKSTFTGMLQFKPLPIMRPNAVATVCVYEVPPASHGEVGERPALTVVPR